ncbi:MAG: methylmalonyl Co-A mutase-associated GTPase MeaB [Actinomycetes bacterium]
MAAAFDDETSARPEQMILGIQAGERRSLAHAITLVESTRTDHRAQAAEILEAVLPLTGNSTRIGISGSPGVGKSTFIEALGLHIVNTGRRVAVLAVDPTSSRTGGSILGDKTRMVDLSNRTDAFIRPSPGGNQLGGVARHTREAMLLCEAAGFDVVIVETIGVGQSEVAVSDMVDLFLLLVAPGGGDELQGIKRGIMELADIVVVNKADGDLAAAAGRTTAEYTNALHLIRPKWASWTPQALSCSSLQRDGIASAWETIEAFGAAIEQSGERSVNRSQQSVAWMWSEVQDTLLDQLRTDSEVQALVLDFERQVAAGTTSPTHAARSLLNVFGNSPVAGS